MHIDPTIFRAYDIRGIAEKTLTTEVVFSLGRVLGSLAREKGESSLVVAKDGRLSGPTLVKALISGIRASGCDVIDIGSVPTPVLYYATTQLNTRSGVMLTGSHNPAEYNGLKMVIKGVMLNEADIQHLYQRVTDHHFAEGEGQYQQLDMTSHYLQALSDKIVLARPLKIVVDAGNGITGDIAPTLFTRLGCKVEKLFCDIDGHFPNHHPDPSEPKNLQALIQAVRDHQADVGLAFDGDGDRLGVVTSAGNIIWPDRVLMLFASALLKQEAGAKIIFDVKCTNHLTTLIQALGGEPIMWKTGHSLIKAKLAETQAQLAGEMSGHFFFKEWFGFDDALYAGAKLLALLSAQAETSHDVFTNIPNSVNTPELKIPIAEEDKFSFMQTLFANVNLSGIKDISVIDGLRIHFADGWGLVRPSNTTPCLILRFEALNEVMLQDIQLRFRQWILSLKPDLVLPF